MMSKETLSPGKTQKSELEDSSQDTSSVVVSTFDEAAKPKRKLFGKISKRRTYIILVASLIVVLVGGYFIYQKIEDHTIVIGNTVITPQDIQNYSDELAAYTKRARETLSESPKQTAQDALILNAALKDQAVKHHVTVDQADIDATLAGQYKSYGSKSAYENFVKAVGVGYVTQIQAENTTYENKLENVVIAKKNLFIVQILDDSPYFNGSTNQAGLRAQAIQILKTKYLPLFEAHESEAQIAAQTDDNLTVAGPHLANSDFFTGMPTVASEFDGCTTAKDCFNDISTGASAKIPGTVSTQSKVNQLTKAGQYTNVFISQAGFIGIMRLESQTPGAYNSWNQLEKSYEQKYAPQFADIGTVNHFVTAAVHNFTQAVGDMIHMLGDLFSPKAYAATGGGPACGGNATGDHFITINVSANDYLTGAGISNVYVKESRTSTTTCYNQDGVYIDDSGLPGHSPNTGNTNGSGNLAFDDNCFDNPPYMNVTAPAGYTFEAQNTSGKNSFMSAEGTAPETISSLSAITGDIASLWQPGINEGSGFSVQLYFKSPAVTKWQLTATSAVQVNGSGSYASTQTVAPGGTIRFRHIVTNIGPDNMEVGWNGRLSSATASLNQGSATAYGAINAGGSQTIYYRATTTGPWTVPSTAANGTKYCQGIVYYPTDEGVSGPGINNSPAGTSVAACVTVSTSTTCTSTCCTGSTCCSGTCCTGTCCTGSACTSQPTPASCSTFTLSAAGNTGYNYGSLYGGTSPGVVPAHTDYRVSVFSHDVSYLAAVASPRTGSTPTGWATFSSAPVLQYPASGYSINSSANPAVLNLTLPPPTGPDRLIYVEYWLHTGSTYTDYIYSEALDNCYSGTCNITLSTTGDVPGGSSTDLEAGTQFNATVTVNNTGIEPLSGLGPGSGNYGNWGFGQQSINIPGGSSQGIVLPPTFNVPTTISTPQLVASAAYGSYSVATCSVTVDVYQPFAIQPNAGIVSPTSSEEPTIITYGTGGNLETGAYPGIAGTDYYSGPISASSLSWLQYEPGGGSSFRTVDSHSNGPDNFGSQTYGPYNYNNPNPIKMGDQYCPEINISPATGWYGPGGSELDTAQSGAVSSGCLTVHDDPYFKVYNNGVAAGGNFGGCSNAGELASWNNNSGTNPPYAFGSSAQFSALALSNIVGFGSDQQAAGAVATAGGQATGSGLTFANTVATGPSDNYSPKQGGQFGSCQPLTDESAPRDAQPTSSVTSTTLPTTTGSYVYRPTSGNLTLTGGTIPVGQNVSMFVTGNVYIAPAPGAPGPTDGIVYQGDSGGSGGSSVVWNSTGDVPSFVLHATGNIYIDPSVTELDGLYISNKTGGAIYTCGVNSGGTFTPMPASELSTCNNQLTVYGNFEADTVNLMRTYGSLRDENPASATSPLTCSNPGIQSSPQTCAAEVFDFSPELYLSSPMLEPPSNGATQFQAITSLPPVL